MVSGWLQCIYLGMDVSSVGRAEVCLFHSLFSALLGRQQCFQWFALISFGTPFGWLDVMNHLIFGFHFSIWFHCDMFDASAWEKEKLHLLYQYLLFNYYLTRMCTSASLSSLWSPSPPPVPSHQWLFCSVQFDIIELMFISFPPVFSQFSAMLFTIILH